MSERILHRYNPAREIQSNFRGIVDVSLREGEQHAGITSVDSYGEIGIAPVEFSFDQSAGILGYLYDIGIEYSEVSNPMAPGIATIVSQLTRLTERPKLLAHIRNHPSDLRAAKETGIEGVNILTTVDEQRLSAMGITLPAYLERLSSLIAEAKADNIETRVGVEHAWKMCYESGGFEKMLQVYRLADEMQVDRVSIADTVGVATHFDVDQVIRALASELRHPEIEVHFHNDTGGATSNALQALVSGANWIDTSLAGYGERTGITPLSCAITRLYSLDPRLVEKYGLEHITPAERYMAKLFHQDVPHDLPTSFNGSTHRAGIHVKDLLRFGPGLYETVPPAVIGNQRQILNGTQGSRISGRTTDADRERFISQFGK